MDFREFAEGITFMECKPLDPVQVLEESNTRLLDEDGTPNHIKIDGLIQLCAIPRMSTFAIGTLINKAVREMPEDQCFVNVGVWHGFTLLAGMLGNPGKKCIGVDNFSEFGGPRYEFRARFNKSRSENHSFFDMEYHDYFHSHHKDQPIGFYIYDGSHDYKNQLEGLQIAEPYLADGALIMVDDTNWSEPRKATMDFMEKSENKYEIIFERATSGNGHPTFWNGIIVIQKNGRKSDAAS